MTDRNFISVLSLGREIEISPQYYCTIRSWLMEISFLYWISVAITTWAYVLMSSCSCVSMFSCFRNVEMRTKFSNNLLRLRKMIGANSSIYFILIKRCQCIRRSVDVSSKDVNVTKEVSVYPYSSHTTLAHQRMKTNFNDEYYWFDVEFFS